MVAFRSLAAGATQSELFAILPEGSIGNAIRFDPDGRMFVADYKKHNIFLVSPDGKDITTYSIPTTSISPTI